MRLSRLFCTHTHQDLDAVNTSLLFRLMVCLLQAFLFDLFSASRPSGLAETLSFLLELLSFFPLSFEGMFENFKNSIFLL